ncbi:hypothetical protein GJQ57_18705 [Ralstonia pickettii]|uniref:Uncharacterized protein n=1 Tax=Ralstonia pickettii TaxID=329 RepID=A0A7X2HQ88_RALPI|nr:hypothetical protein [Ralstonia pickettii]MRT00678.1 hypothetical protein [Ralstonia pickettii]
MTRGIGDHFYTPGFWTAFTALAMKRGVRYADLKFSSSARQGYAEAIHLPVALGAEDCYPYSRVNEGRNYSGLVLLESADSTDAANSNVAGCVRNFLAGLGVDSFAQVLVEVIGDLHDNVWSHGKSTGFSMAQLFNNRCEFALADCGYGFLRELQRVGLKEVMNHADAINWCIQKGNSSKRLKQEDPWEQRLPADVMGNPMPGFAKARESDNHHMGLGLAKLMSAVDTYGGRLWLATGDTLLHIDGNGNRMYSTLPTEWPGVALACRFHTARVKKLAAAEAPDEVTDALMQLLGGQQ